MQYLFTLSGYLVTLLIHKKNQASKHWIGIALSLYFKLKDFLLQMAASFLKSSLWHRIWSIEVSLPPLFGMIKIQLDTMIYFLRHT